ncbi:CPBP family intramembrane glutamic endopeptidase [Thermicanus aegyptius]|uniref:CPBP family intramembrane glutamic endopeptidase n=1 Tax=Thermicanus aegyptius TaxID=94009 RepID=UPI00069350EB|nr:CPBP family intramembrane glutamic endopeptidase [Thermicanus aegyptius]
MEPQINVNIDPNVNKSKHKRYFVSYFILFYVAWASARLFWVKPGVDTIPASLLEAVVKIAIWVLPVFVFLRTLDRTNPILYLKLNKKPKANLWTGSAIIITAILLYINDHLLGDAEFGIFKGLSYWLNGVLLAGIIEEIVFRGFILQKMSAFMKFYKANLLTSFLFVLIHFPIWIANNQTLESFISNSIVIFLLALIWGYTFKRTGSLWSVIVFHSFFNLLIALGF